MTDDINITLEKVRNCPFCGSADTFGVKLSGKQKPSKHTFSESVKTVFKLKCDDCEKQFKISVKYTN